MLQGFPAYFEKSSGILRRYASVDAYKRPDNWLQNYNKRVSGVTMEKAQKELNALIDINHLAIVIVGDWNIAGQAVADLNLGEIVYLDHNGRPVNSK